MGIQVETGRGFRSSRTFEQKIWVVTGGDCSYRLWSGGPRRMWQLQRERGVWTENLFPNLRGGKRERRTHKGKKGSQTEMEKVPGACVGMETPGSGAFPGKNQQTKEKSPLFSASPLDGAIRGPPDPHRSARWAEENERGRKVSSTASCSWGVWNTREKLLGYGLGQGEFLSWVERR